jgi:hypothetical protein
MSSGIDNGCRRMLDASPWALSIAGYAFSSITRWRNEAVLSNAKNPVEQDKARWTAGVVYALLPLLFLIETLVRAIIALLLLPAMLIVRVKESDFYKKYLFVPFILGTLINATQIASSAVASEANVTQDEIQVDEINKVAICSCFSHFTDELYKYAAHQPEGVPQRHIYGGTPRADAISPHGGLVVGDNAFSEITLT